LPRRPGRDPNHVSLSHEEVELQDRIRADRDRIAQKLEIEPTLIANRAQLAQIARDPRRLGDVLLPSQADLLRSEPALKALF
jgi:ribonuclease D